MVKTFFGPVSVKETSVLIHPFARVQKKIWPFEIISSKKKSSNNLFNDLIRTAWLSRIYQYV